VIYFRCHREVKLLDFDGGGINIASREVQMTEESLWKAAVAAKEDMIKAIRYMNLIAYLDVPLLGDLNSVWDIRMHCKY
jgi:hypothetical protein